MNQKVVLLDGDQRFLQQLIEAFTKGGWHVAATTDGVQALRECRDADLLVTELVLPGMDGIEVIEEMKKSCPAKALVISGIRDNLRSIFLGNDSLSLASFCSRYYGFSSVEVFS